MKLYFHLQEIDILASYKEDSYYLIILLFVVLLNWGWGYYTAESVEAEGCFMSEAFLVLPLCQCD